MTEAKEHIAEKFSLQASPASQLSSPSAAPTLVSHREAETHMRFVGTFPYFFQGLREMTHYYNFNSNEIPTVFVTPI